MKPCAWYELEQKLLCDGAEKNVFLCFSVCERTNLFLLYSFVY